MGSRDLPPIEERHPLVYRRAMSRMQRQSPTHTSHRMVRGVVELVAQYHGMRPEILLARTRVRDVMDARQVAMYVARRCTTASLVLIGRIHGRHHSTVIHDIRAVQNRIDTIPGYGRFVEGIEKAASRRTGIHAATVRAIIHRADRAA